MLRQDRSDPTGPAIQSIDQAIEELRRRPRNMWLDLARDDQSARWRQGAGVPAEEYLAYLPELHSPIEDALVLICGEVELRRELAEDPTWEEYRDRFPEWAAELALQFEVSRLIFPRNQNPPDAMPSQSPEVEELPRLTGFEFVAELGRGASGVVFKARQQSLDRLVAIKVVGSIGSDEKKIARLRQEAEILAQLQHPNIVHIYEVVCKRGSFYLVMELVDGPTLGDRAQDRLFAPNEAARLIKTLAEAVHVVHQAGILHRDLKPSNVLLTSAGQPKITDFGLAKQQSSDNLLTTQDSILGTPSYMSPEQAAGDVQSIGVESDVYSLGAMLYELLTGRPPFLGATVLDTLSQIREHDPVPPRRLQAKLPADLETICLKCLSKSPVNRYTTAQALADDLQRFLQGLPIVARRASAWQRARRFIRRRPAVSTAIAALIFLVVVTAVGFSISDQQRRQLAAKDLVESIATANPQVLPELLGRTAGQSIILPQIRLALAAAKPGDIRWVNLALAELNTDHTAPANSLLEYLPTARPVEMPILVSVLASRGDNIQQELWSLLLENNTTAESRLRLACLAAKISPADPRWSIIAPDVAASLAHQDPVEIGAFSSALLPARTALIPALVQISREANVEPLIKHIVTSLLADFAADQPEILVEQIVTAEPAEFKLLLPALLRQRDESLAKLKPEIEQSVHIQELWNRPAIHTNHDVERAYDAAQRRRANALVAMWELGKPEAALEALQRTADPARRAWLIEQSAPMGVTTDMLWHLAGDADNSGVREAGILALGQASLKSLKPIDRDALVTDLATWYQQDADAGVHSACSWLLRTRLDREEVVEKIDSLPRGKFDSARGWCVGPNGHIFAVFQGPVKFTMGSPAYEVAREDDETLHQVRVDHSFAVATIEVTTAQFCRFREEADVNRQYSPTDDCPANNVSWFEAAAYCRWLSEQDGLPEDQMCYPPIDQIKPGMHIPHNWMKRTGYRLPTTTEWEYACRGGVGASRSCGEGGQLLAHYAWYLNNSDERAWPVGQLKPNSFGMFDMLGNMLERCQNIKEVASTDALELSSVESNDGPPGNMQAIGGEMTTEIRGGSFGDPSQNVRSARRASSTTSDKWASVGFRVARSL